MKKFAVLFEINQYYTNLTCDKDLSDVIHPSVHRFVYGGPSLEGSPVGSRDELQKNGRRVGGIRGRCNGMGAISCCQGSRGVGEGCWSKVCRCQGCRCQGCRGQGVIVPGDYLAAAGRHDWRRYRQGCRQDRTWCRCRCRCGANGGEEKGEDALQEPIRFAY